MDITGFRRLSALGVACLWLSGCATTLTLSDPVEDDGDARVTLEQAAQGSNAFAFDLYRAVAQDSDNLFFSPASISLAMGYAYRGADGQTADQLRRVMQFPGGPEASIYGAGELDRSMSFEGEGRELRSANAFWVHTDLKIESDYTADLGREASGALNSVDFTADPEGARKRINRWVSGQTNDRIEELIPPKVIEQTTAAVLVNAVYWNGEWLRPFDKEGSREDTFFLGAGEEIQTRLMRQQNDFRAIKRGSVKLIDLPYKGDEVSLVAILPDRLDGLAALERSLTAPRLERWLEALEASEPRGTIVTLPALSLDWKADLVRVIEEMGAPLPFSAQANFDRMAKFPLTADGRPTGRIGGMPTCGLTITNIIHQANIDVDEKGSEAAAATAVVMDAIVISGSRRVKPPPPPFIFRADHPFMFLLRDKRTDAILFIGRLVDPSQEETDGPPPDLSPTPTAGADGMCPPKL